MKQEKTTVLRKLSIYGFEAVAGSHSFWLVGFRHNEATVAIERIAVCGYGRFPLSFLLKAIGRCLTEYPELNSMIDLKRTTTFAEVDIAIPIEIVHGGKWATKQYVIRNINNKTLKQVDDEINGAKRNEGGEKGYVASSLVQKLIGILPKRIVLFLFRYVMRSHERVKDLSGTVFVTSVSMFSNIPGYIIPFSGGPKAVSFAIGSSMKKPVVKGDEILIREILNITVIFNHDIVDGAPAARFINQLRKYIEVNYRDLM